MSRFAQRSGYKKQHASCNRQSEIYTLKSSGVLAQLVERLNGIEEVTGSNPVGSTPFFPIGRTDDYAKPTVGAVIRVYDECWQCDRDARAQGRFQRVVAR